jgi:peptide/nickel transport system permease protein
MPPLRPADRRRRTLLLLLLGGLMVAAIVVGGWAAQDAATTTNLHAVSRPPSMEHWLGTDRLGRDMLARTVVGLRLSLAVGTISALVSSLIALVLAALAVTGGRLAAAVVEWLINLFLALPHLVLLILIAFALGGGTTAVVLAIGLTHWPALTRVLTAQARRVIGSEYVAGSRDLGSTAFRIARHHVVPHLLPYLLVGAVLMFPHAILHEAALSFLGLGIDSDQPAIGVLLADSMKVLSAGKWWLAVLPGACLLVLTKVIDSIGANLRALLDPRSFHQ